MKYENVSIRKTVDPPGQAKANWEIVTALAQKLGLNGFDFTSVKDVYDDMRKVTPQYAGITYERIERPVSLVF
jgi:formate dehydrogenase major subunit